MAAVRGESDGHIRLCVLEKENGEWKLIQIGAIHKDGYDMNNLMNRLEGDWTLDKATVKVENNQSHLEELKANIEKLGSKFSMVSTLTWKNGAGGVFDATETLELVPDMSLPEVRVLRSFAWHNGWADASSGILAREGNIVSGQLKSIGRTNNFNLSLDFSENNRIRCTYQLPGEEGEGGWSIQYDLVRD